MNEVMAYFHPAEPKVNFSALEGVVLAFWAENRTFQKSIEQRSIENSYVFYDGPPFATGLPHYGNIMTSIVKDVIPRFFTMNGLRVERRFGWDCHGVPVEFELEKEIGIEGQADIEAMGIANFNEACRSIVLRYTKQWETIISRVGRWVDFRNDYKTMNLPYMETVWWVFKTLWDKGLIYEDYKVVHYSWRLSTPYSNFEATLDDAYRERQDPSVIVRFKSDDQEADLLAWTTTPWTLPSNMALAVHPDLTYCKLTAGDEATYILAKDLIAEHFEDEAYDVVSEFEGRVLIGQTYQPLFPYFADKKGDGAFKIVGGDFVSAEDGTGVVHIAPAFGEDDFYVAKTEGIPLVNPVNDAGEFTQDVADFAGRNVFAANPNIIHHLSERNKLFSHKTISHNYPHDWRTDTPLIYRAIPSWYVNVRAIKDRMLANNARINWYPSHVKDGAFGKWLENARDWAISRNRYWGAPIPVWRCRMCDHIGVFGSIAELQAAADLDELADIHRHFIDEIEIPCLECGDVMKRVPEVLDCWFESGSMPYAQVHYPFENEVWFRANFPADFIVEYIGQTRGWFYTLMVLSSALFNEPPFQNALAHGVLLGEDGRKMSKRLRNFPEVSQVLSESGADALRLYLMGHPVMDGVDSRIEGQGIPEMLRRFVIPVWNAFSFFTRYADVDHWRPTDAERHSGPDLDRWIRSRTYALTYHMADALGAYNLRGAVQLLLDFVDDLNNWYIRRSRERFWKSTQDDDKAAAYETLHEVLVLLCKVAAPLTPFVTEAIFKNLTGKESVHLEDWPAPDPSLIDAERNQRMATVRQIASLGLAARAKAQVKVRQPLGKASVKTKWPLGEAEVALLRDELNVKAIEVLDDVSRYADIVVKPQGALIGPKFGRATSQIIQAVKEGRFETLPDSRVKVAGNEAWILGGEAIEVYYQAKPGYACEIKADLVVVLDLHLTEVLTQEGLAREIVRHIQTLRKEADFRLDDRIVAGVFTEDANMLAALATFEDHIRAEILADALLTSNTSGWTACKRINVDGTDCEVAIKEVR